MLCTLSRECNALVIDVTESGANRPHDWVMARIYHLESEALPSRSRIPRELMEALEMSSRAERKKRLKLIQQGSKLNLEGQPVQKNLPTRLSCLFFVQLAMLLDSGIAIPRAIDILLEHATDKMLQRALRSVARSLTQGKKFHEALEKTGVFTLYQCKSVQAGEQTGALTKILNLLAKHEEKSFAASQKLKSMLAYPVFMIGVSVVAMILGPHYISGPVTEACALAGQSLGWAMNALFQVSAMANLLFTSPWFWLALVMAIALWGKTLTQAFRFPIIQKTLWNLGYKTPGLSKLLNTVSKERFARALAFQLESGRNLDQALWSSAQITTNPLFLEAAVLAVHDVRNGSSLEEALAPSELFDDIFLSMVKTGGESGKLPILLTKLANMLTEDLEHNVGRALDVLQPAMLMALGAGVGGFAYAMLKPMSQLIQAL